MIKWISVDTPPAKCDFCKQYLVTCEYNGLGNIKEMKCKGIKLSIIVSENEDMYLKECNKKEKKR